MCKIKFSVLISIYKKENDIFLLKSLESITNQSLLPNEIIIVKDGVLTKKLDKVVNDYYEKYKKEIKIEVISLNKNVGLGNALNEGLKHCSNEWIARMDSDDISLKERFEITIKNIAINPEVDVIGSHITEFESRTNEILGIRKVKTNHKEILIDLKKRNPMNHVTVFVKKSKIIDSGGYQDFKSFEDYFLWARMIKNGAIFKNINQSLVLVRAGNEMINRRRGYGYMIQEFKMQKFLYSAKLTSFWSMVGYSFIRGFGRVLPKNIIIKVYKLYRS